MYSFIVQNARWLAAGLVLSFGSAPGQVWLISLFSNDIKATWSLTDGQWGSLYTISTLAAAACLFWKGGLVDTMPTRRLTLAIMAGFALSCALMSINGPVIILVIALFGLRFFGHSMFTHVAMTTTGKWFRGHRGRALAIVGLGYSIAEILWPQPVVLGIAHLGAPTTWLLIAAFIALVLMPLQALLLRRERVPVGSAESNETQGLNGKHWTRREALHHWLLPALLPLMMATPVLCTTTYFHQSHIAITKGWTFVEMAPGYAAFAITMILGSFAAGWFSDRFGPTRLLPLFLLPLATGLALISPAVAVSQWFAVLGLLGLSMGMAITLWGALLPNVFGTNHLGSVRSLTSTITVVAVAIGPGAAGLLIDAGIGYAFQARILAAGCVALCILGLLIRINLLRQNPNRFSPA